MSLTSHPAAAPRQHKRARLVAAPVSDDIPHLSSQHHPEEQKSSINGMGSSIVDQSSTVAVIDKSDEVASKSSGKSSAEKVRSDATSLFPSGSLIAKAVATSRDENDLGRTTEFSFGSRGVRIQKKAPGDAVAVTSQWGKKPANTEDSNSVEDQVGWTKRATTAVDAKDGKGISLDDKSTPGSSLSAKPTIASFSKTAEASSKSAEEWKCPSCGASNPSSATSCGTCMSNKPGVKPSFSGWGKPSTTKASSEVDDAEEQTGQSSESSKPAEKPSFAGWSKPAPPKSKLEDTGEEEEDEKKQPAFSFGKSAKVPQATELGGAPAKDDNDVKHDGKKGMEKAAFSFGKGSQLPLGSVNTANEKESSAPALGAKEEFADKADTSATSSNQPPKFSFGAGSKLVKAAPGSVGAVSWF